MNNPHNFTDIEWLILCNRINAFGKLAPFLRELGKVQYVLWKAYHPEITEPTWMKPIKPMERGSSVNSR